MYGKDGEWQFGQGGGKNVERNAISIALSRTIEKKSAMPTGIAPYACCDETVGPTPGDSPTELE